MAANEQIIADDLIWPRGKREHAESYLDPPKRTPAEHCCHFFCPCFAYKIFRYKFEHSDLEHGQIHHGRATNEQMTDSLPHGIAICNYEKEDEETDEELSVEKGNRYAVLDDTFFSQSEDWSYVSNMDMETEREMGYLPKYTIVNIPPRCNWFAGNNQSATSRRDAERQLTSAGKLPDGTFLVRERKNHPGEFALTVLVDQSTKPATIKHYRMLFTAGGMVRLGTRGRCFPDIPTLLEHYKASDHYSHGLCCALTVPLPQLIPTSFPFYNYNLLRVPVIPLDCLTIGEQLGKGHFSEVYAGNLRHDDWVKGVSVAIKIIKIPSKTTEEVDNMAQCTLDINAAIVRLYGITSIDSQLCLISERMEGGDLQNLLQTYPHRINTVTLMDTLVQVAEAMHFMEQKNVVHLDLRTSNVMIGEKEYGVSETTGLRVLHRIPIKIGDFGQSKLLTEQYYDILHRRQAAVEAAELQQQQEQQPQTEEKQEDGDETESPLEPQEEPFKLCLRWTAPEVMIYRSPEEVAALRAAQEEEQQQFPIIDEPKPKQKPRFDPENPDEPQTKLPYEGQTEVNEGFEADEDENEDSDEDADKRSLHPRIHERSDVWSFGVLGCELFDRADLPYREIFPPPPDIGPTADEMLAYLEEGHRLAKPPDMPAVLYDVFIEKCWRFDAADRSTFAELLEEHLNQIMEEEEYKEQEDSGSECDEYEDDDDYIPNTDTQSESSRASG